MSYSSKNNYEAARRLRREMTRPEVLLWREVRGRRSHGLKFYRQRPVGRFVLDFHCPQLRLALEVDGPVHEEPERAELDAQRQMVLEAAGIRFVRISAVAIEQDPRAARSPPSPL